MDFLTNKIIKVNNLGKNNLADKGVQINGTETTYELM
jgi:hypothetical protein